MSSGLTEEKFEEPDFKWIKKKGVGGKNKNVQFYESFVYDGVEYHLYDSVYMNNQGEPPYIGKLVKIWENSDASKKVKIHWFFRPWEISKHLGNTVAQENELFLASGDGIGLANLNPLEAIAGKCNVICISRDMRNRQPTAEELQMANYVFYRTFDVKSLTISDQINDTVGGIKVEFVFNRKESFKTIEATAGGELLMLAGKKAPEQLKHLKLDENSNHTVEKREATDVKRLQTKRESLQGETKGVSSSKEAASGGKSYLDAHVNSSKDEETMETNEKLKVLGSKNVGCKIFDKVNDMKPPVIQAQFEEGMKSARKLGDIDEKPAKRVRIDDTVTSAKDQCTIVVQNSNVPRNDAMSPVARVISSNAQAKAELIYNFVGPGKEDAKLAGKSVKVSIEMNTHSKADAYSSNKISSVGHDVDHEKSFLKNTKDSIVAKDLCPSVERSLKIAKLNDSPENNKDKSAPKSIKIAPSEIKRSTSEIKQSPSEVKKSNTLMILKEEKSKSRLPKNLGKLDYNFFKDYQCQNTSMLPYGNSTKLSIASDKGKDGKVDGQIFEVTRRPVAEKSKWFKELPWEQRMKTSHDEGTLVLLLNLDPELTSGEVEDIIFHAFEESCAARMVQHIAISNPHYGQAFAIFKTREAAERIVKELDDHCLMLPNNRPLIGGFAVLPNLSEKQTTLVGHLAIRRQLHRDMKEAVSTSHYSQTNTIEYEMAMSWCLLQSKADRWWTKLYEQQNVSLKKLTSDLKSK